MNKTTLYHFLIIFCAIIITNSLHSFTIVNNITASAIVGIVGYIFFKNDNSIPALIYSASFIGMSPKLELYEVLLLSVTLLIISQYMNKKLVGFGGKLGMMAFISGVILLMVRLCL